MIWHDDEFRYDGQRPAWDAARDPWHDDYQPMRGYVANVQHRIDDPDFDHLGMAAEGGGLPCRG